MMNKFTIVYNKSMQFSDAELAGVEWVAEQENYVGVVLLTRRSKREFDFLITGTAARQRTTIACHS